MLRSVGHGGMGGSVLWILLPSLPSLSSLFPPSLLSPPSPPSLSLSPLPLLSLPSLLSQGARAVKPPSAGGLYTCCRPGHHPGPALSSVVHSFRYETTESLVCWGDYVSSHAPDLLDEGGEEGRFSKTILALREDQTCEPALNPPAPGVCTCSMSILAHLLYSCVTEVSEQMEHER